MRCLVSSCYSTTNVVNHCLGSISTGANNVTYGVLDVSNSLHGNVGNSLLEGVDSVGGVSTEGLYMSLQGVNVSRQLILDGVEVSLGSVHQSSSRLLGLSSKISNSLLKSIKVWSEGVSNAASNTAQALLSLVPGIRQ